MECEKIHINNTFESILGEDVPYSIVVKNITAEETRDMSKAFAMDFFVFLIYYILNLQYPKKFEATFFYQFRSSYGRCSVKKGVLRNFAKFTRKHMCQRLY